MAACWYLYRAFIMIHPLKTQKKKLSSTKKKLHSTKTKKATTPKLPTSIQKAVERSRSLPFRLPGRGPVPRCRLGVLPRFFQTEKWVGHWTHFLVELGWTLAMSCSAYQLGHGKHQRFNRLVFAYFQRVWLVPKYWKWARPRANLLDTQG